MRLLIFTILLALVAATPTGDELTARKDNCSGLSYFILKADGGKYPGWFAQAPLLYLLPAAEKPPMVFNIDEHGYLITHNSTATYYSRITPTAASSTRTFLVLEQKINFENTNPAKCALASRTDGTCALQCVGHVSDGSARSVLYTTNHNNPDGPSEVLIEPTSYNNPKVIELVFLAQPTPAAG